MLLITIVAITAILTVVVVVVVVVVIAVSILKSCRPNLKQSLTLTLVHLRRRTKCIRLPSQQSRLCVRRTIVDGSFAEFKLDACEVNPQL